ncbi:MAG: hypothetical protein A3G87_05165 [Omnitrophica bacterium RIFCSPLOWO2_12_FULL_50_11]|nr:MAG: hypothetical protein A3G87_05165 [Omnitrophica bacterium RIFCSPLOWO2_12_FULL_50_11]
MKPRVVIGLVLPLLFLPSFFTHVVLWRIEDYLGIKVSRKPILTFHPGKIDLSGTAIEWNDGLRTQSGILEVRYPLHRALLGDIPISVDAKELAVTFGPRWSQVIGQEHVVFDHVSARVLATSTGQIQVDYLNAESKTIQFHLKGSEP